MAVKTVKFGTVEYLQAENIPVSHCFTTRIGGVSGGNTAGLNIGVGRGDPLENVTANYNLLANALGLDPHRLVLANQVHGGMIRSVTAKDACGFDHRDYPECDGLITNEAGVGLVVFTADFCGNAVRAMVNTYGCKPENIRAAIGPNIGQCCFETDADVPQAMLRVYGDAANEYISHKNHKYYVNLKGMNAYALRRVGVENIAISDHCTACMPQRYWSHRKMGASRGSQGAIILCQEVQP